MSQQYALNKVLDLGGLDQAEFRVLSQLVGVPEPVNDQIGLADAVTILVYAAFKRTGLDDRQVYAIIRVAYPGIRDHIAGFGSDIVGIALLDNRYLTMPQWEKSLYDIYEFCWVSKDIPPAITAFTVHFWGIVDLLNKS